MEPDTAPQPAPEAPKPAPSYGGILAIVLVLALIVVGAFYVWGERISETGLTEQEQEYVESLEAQGDSTEPSDIESDLDAQSTEDFERELDEAYAELDASFGS